MSFSKDLWQGFGSIKKEFVQKRNHIKTLLYFISEHRNLEYEYAEGLSRLALTKFDHLNNETTFQKAIQAYISSIEKESIERMNYVKSTEINVINPLNTLIKEQMKMLEIQYVDKQKISKDFEQILTNLTAVQKDFYSSIIISEATLTKLNQAKANPKNTPEQITELSRRNDKKIIIVKDFKMRYEDYVNDANNAREKYINSSCSILSLLEEMELVCINLTRECLMKNNKQRAEEENQLLKLNQVVRAAYESISTETDMNQFIAKNKTHYSFPSKFAFIPYDMNSMLKINNDPNPELSEIKMQVYQVLNEIISYKTPEINEDPQYNEKIKQIEDIMFTFWEGKVIDEAAQHIFDAYLTKAIYRRHLLNILNRYRSRGLFEINQNCFNQIGSAMNKIITYSIVDKDFFNLESCLILSQTFSFNQKFLQNSIQGNEGLRLKDTWVGLIDNSIEEKVYSVKGYKDVLIENEDERVKKLRSVIFGILMTFSYNMRLFGVSYTLIKDIITSYCEKYSIKQEKYDELQINQINGVETFNHEVQTVNQNGM